MQNDNDIERHNDGVEAYATITTNPAMNLRSVKKTRPSGIGLAGFNNTRFTPFNIIAKNTQSKKALPDNKKRNYIMIQNNSAADIFVGFGINVGTSGSNGFVVSGGGFYELDNHVPFNSVFIRGTGISQSVLMIEGTVDK